MMFKANSFRIIGKNGSGFEERVHFLNKIRRFDNLGHQFQELYYTYYEGERCSGREEKETTFIHSDQAVASGVNQQNRLAILHSRLHD
jgi:hypothetical protein